MIDERELFKSGFNGYDTVTYEVMYINGGETGRTTIVSVDEIVRIGTHVIETKNQTFDENFIAYSI